MKKSTLASLICIALSAGALSGCDFYDEPSTSETITDTTPEPTPDEPTAFVSTTAELIAAIDTAETGDFIGLSTTGDFSNTGTIILDKAITLISADALGNILEVDGDTTTDQAVFTGAVCIDIPTEAVETLNDGNQVRISNIAFENIIMDSCGSGESTSNSIINIGKVGKGKTAVLLDNLTFDGTSFTETTGSSDAWVYSRGLVDLSDSTFTNKSENAQSILYLNCGSSTSRGGSNDDPRGSTFTGNTFSLAGLNSAGVVKAATIGVPSNLGQDNKNCATTFTDNTFENFTYLISETSDPSTALYDVFGDTVLTDNTLVNDLDDTTTPPVTGTTDPKNVDELNAAILAATAGSTITLGAGDDYDFSAGTITIDKAIKLVGEDGALITGTACIDVLDAAVGTEISNITFTEITLDVCGDTSGSSSNSIINIGKVGKDKLGVTLDKLNFDGAEFIEPTGSSDAWIYSRGLVDISDSIFANKSADAQNILYLNCGSSASRGGSNSDPRGSIFSNNTFALAEFNASGMTKAATIGVPSNLGQEDKNCATTFTANTFTNFSALISTTEDNSTALYDVFGDTTESENILESTPTEEPVLPLNVAEINAAIVAAESGATITLGAGDQYDYSSGVITIDKAIKLVGQEGATISGNTCIDVVDGAAGAEISNITFANDAIALCGTTDDAKEAVINIQKVGEDEMPIILTDLTFNTTLITSQDQIENKGAWIRSYGFINLTNSSFTTQDSGLQNDLVKLTCSSSKGKMGTLIDGNLFSIAGADAKETAAIKIGDSSSGAIKDADNENNCNVTVSNNTFTGYTFDIVNSVGSSGARDAAIFARLESESTNQFPGNTFN
ncbi:hypothetical protein [Shewanella metallivivens]|uniref:Uncharacterized protein n=1 Tax=Shewanella metallivivens TaxID=2872342 RepID=A0ABT5TIW4_9GAMM|nr:hypothetical protein [Shewanella metallivivens]MDD8058542.1 hypothetical protein [Shewanella metallivivens]